jgi:hypothetical protein
VVATSCPKSVISGQSMAWLEEYYAWKLTGGGDYRALSARRIDAFCTLEQVLATERNGSHE